MYCRYPSTPLSCLKCACTSCSTAMSMLTGENNGEMRLYEDLGDYAAIKPIFEEILALYNTKRKAMTLVFFEDALEHLTRISRTMRLPQV